MPAKVAVARRLLTDADEMDGLEDVMQETAWMESGSKYTAT